HAAVAVPDEHRIGNAVHGQFGEHVGHVCLEVDPGVQQVRALGDTGQRDGQHPVPAGPQLVGEIVEAPRAVTGTGYQDVGGHACTLSAGGTPPRRAGGTPTRVRVRVSWRYLPVTRARSAGRWVAPVTCISRLAATAPAVSRRRTSS